MRELLFKIRKVNQTLINAPKGHFQEVWDEFDRIHYVDPAEEAEKEMTQLLYKLGQNEEFFFLMTLKERGVSQRMLEDIHKSLVVEAAFVAEIEAHQKSYWNESLSEVEREVSGELAKEALNKLYEAKEKTTLYKEAYAEFIWDIYVRLDV